MIQKHGIGIDLDHHDHNQKSCGNLCVPIQKIDAPSQSPIKECRICMEGESEGRMINPCLCSGTVSYAHEKCIISWIYRKYQPKSKAKVKCEVCQAQFQYRIYKTHSLSLETLKENVNKQKCNFIAFFFIALVLLIGIIGLTLIVCLSGGEGETGASIRKELVKTQNIKIVYICIIFLILIMLTFMTSLFLTEYAVKGDYVINQVKGFSDIKDKKKTKPEKVYPKVLTIETN